MIFDLMGFGGDPGSFKPAGMARHGVEVAPGCVEAGAIAAPRMDITAPGDGEPVLRGRSD